MEYYKKVPSWKFFEQQKPGRKKNGSKVTKFMLKDYPGIEVGPGHIPVKVPSKTYTRVRNNFRQNEFRSYLNPEIVSKECAVSPTCASATVKEQNSGTFGSQENTTSPVTSLLRNKTENSNSSSQDIFYSDSEESTTSEEPRFLSSKGNKSSLAVNKDIIPDSEEFSDLPSASLIQRNTQNSNLFDVFRFDSDSEEFTALPVACILRTPTPDSNLNVQGTSDSDSEDDALLEGGCLLRSNPQNSNLSEQGSSSEVDTDSSAAQVSKTKKRKSKASTRTSSDTDSDLNSSSSVSEKVTKRRKKKRKRNFSSQEIFSPDSEKFAGLAEACLLKENSNNSTLRAIAEACSLKPEPANSNLFTPVIFDVVSEAAALPEPALFKTLPKNLHLYPEIYRLAGFGRKTVLQREYLLRNKPKTSNLSAEDLFDSISKKVDVPRVQGFLKTKSQNSARGVSVPFSRGNSVVPGKSLLKRKQQTSDLSARRNFASVLEKNTAPAVSYSLKTKQQVPDLNSHHDFDSLFKENSCLPVSSLAKTKPPTSDLSARMFVPDSEVNPVLPVACLLKTSTLGSDLSGQDTFDPVLRENPVLPVSHLLKTIPSNSDLAVQDIFDPVAQDDTFLPAYSLPKTESAVLFPQGDCDPTLEDDTVMPVTYLLKAETSGLSPQAIYDPIPLENPVLPVAHLLKTKSQHPNWSEHCHPVLEKTFSLKQANSLKAEEETSIIPPQGVPDFISENSAVLPVSCLLNRKSPSSDLPAEAVLNPGSQENVPVPVPCFIKTEIPDSDSTHIENPVLPVSHLLKSSPPSPDLSKQRTVDPVLHKNSSLQQTCLSQENSVSPVTCFIKSEVTDSDLSISDPISEDNPVLPVAKLLKSKPPFPVLDPVLHKNSDQQQAYLLETKQPLSDLPSQRNSDSVAVLPLLKRKCPNSGLPAQAISNPVSKESAVLPVTCFIKTEVTESDLSVPTPISIGNPVLPVSHLLKHKAPSPDLPKPCNLVTALHKNSVQQQTSLLKTKQRTSDLPDFISKKHALLPVSCLIKNPNSVIPVQSGIETISKEMAVLPVACLIKSETPDSDFSSPVFYEPISKETPVLPVAHLLKTPTPNSEATVQDIVNPAYEKISSLIKTYLKTKQPTLDLPSQSTSDPILKKNAVLPDVHLIKTKHQTSDLDTQSIPNYIPSKNVALPEVHLLKTKHQTSDLGLQAIPNHIPSENMGLPVSCLLNSKPLSTKLPAKDIFESISKSQDLPEIEIFEQISPKNSVLPVTHLLKTKPQNADLSTQVALDSALKEKSDLPVASLLSPDPVSEINTALPEALLIKTEKPDSELSEGNFNSVSEKHSTLPVTYLLKTRTNSSQGIFEPISLENAILPVGCLLKTEIEGWDPQSNIDPVFEDNVDLPVESLLKTNPRESELLAKDTFCPISKASVALPVTQGSFDPILREENALHKYHSLITNAASSNLSSKTIVNPIFNENAGIPVAVLYEGNSQNPDLSTPASSGPIFKLSLVSPGNFNPISKEEGALPGSSLLKTKPSSSQSNLDPVLKENGALLSLLKAKAPNLPTDDGFQLYKLYNTVSVNLPQTNKTTTKKNVNKKDKTVGVNLPQTNKTTTKKNVNKKDILDETPEVTVKRAVAIRTYSKATPVCMKMPLELVQVVANPVGRPLKKIENKSVPVIKRIAKEPVPIMKEMDSGVVLINPNPVSGSTDLQLPVKTYSLNGKVKKIERKPLSIVKKVIRKTVSGSMNINLNPESCSTQLNILNQTHNFNESPANLSTHLPNTKKTNEGSVNAHQAPVKHSTCLKSNKKTDRKVVNRNRKSANRSAGFLKKQTDRKPANRSALSQIKHSNPNPANRSKLLHNVEQDDTESNNRDRTLLVSLDRNEVARYMRLHKVVKTDTEVVPEIKPDISKIIESLDCSDTDVKPRKIGGSSKCAVPVLHKSVFGSIIPDQVLINSDIIVPDQIDSEVIVPIQTTPDYSFLEKMKTNFVRPLDADFGVLGEMPVWDPLPVGTLEKGIAVKHEPIHAGSVRENSDCSSHEESSGIPVVESQSTQDLEPAKTDVAHNIPMKKPKTGPQLMVNDRLSLCDLESILSEWIKFRRKDRVLISQSKIRHKAMKMAQEMSIQDFKADVPWCNRFMKRLGYLPDVIKVPESVSEKPGSSVELGPSETETGDPLSTTSRTEPPSIDLNGYEDSSQMEGSKTRCARLTGGEESYTLDFKFRAFRKAVQVGFKLAAKALHVNEFYIRKWKKEIFEDIWPTLEEPLSKWIKAQSENGLSISMSMIQCKAISLAKELSLGNFKGDARWCHNFLNRYKQNEDETFQVALEKPNIPPRSNDNVATHFTEIDVVQDNPIQCENSQSCANVETTGASKLSITARNTYPLEFKAEAVLRASVIDKRQASKRYGVNNASFWNWASQSCGLKTQRTYSADFKASTVRLASKIGIFKASRKCGVNVNMVSDWIRKREELKSNTEFLSTIKGLENVAL